MAVSLLPPCCPSTIDLSSLTPQQTQSSMSLAGAQVNCALERNEHCTADTLHSPTTTTCSNSSSRGSSLRRQRCIRRCHSTMASRRPTTHRLRLYYLPLSQVRPTRKAKATRRLLPAQRRPIKTRGATLRLVRARAVSTCRSRRLESSAASLTLTHAPIHAYPSYARTALW